MYAVCERAYNKHIDPHEPPQSKGIDSHEPIWATGIDPGAAGTYEDLRLWRMGRL